MSGRENSLKNSTGKRHMAGGDALRRLARLLGGQAAREFHASSRRAAQDTNTGVVGDEEINREKS